MHHPSQAAKPTVSRINRKGAAIGEYGILVGLVSAVTIGSVGLLGGKVDLTLQTASNSIAEQREALDKALSEIAFSIPAGQSFFVMPYSENGDIVGQVRTTGGDASRFDLLTGGEGFTINDDGVVIISDTLAMPAAGSTRDAGVEAEDATGKVSTATVTFDRSQTGDAPNSTDTWAKLAVDGATRSDLSPEDNGDWFRFTAPADGFQLHVVAEGYDHHGWMAISNPNFRLLDSSGSEVSRYSRVGTEYALFEWLNAGEYFLDVSGINETGGYRVFAYEVVDIPTSRGKSAQGTFGVAGESTLLTGDPGDTWRYTLDTPGSVTITVSSKDLGTGTGALPDPDFRVLDKDGVQISRHGTSGSVETATTDTLPAGDFYVQVITTDPSQDGGYSVLVER